MKGFLALIVALSTAVRGQSSHGEEAEAEMGPVAFMWPPDRTWGAAYDNNAPCGSNSGVVNRTEFPLVNGQLALVTQDESWNVQIAISHKNNPTTNEDFNIIVDQRRIQEIDEGHTCYAVPNPGVDTEEGMNATFQIKYTADFETDKNETYYACADVTYVAASKFTYQVPCFNATVDEFTLTDSDDDDSSSSNNSNSNSDSASSGSSIETGSSGGGGGGLSGGAIAGIVVGAVAALAIALVLLFGYRRLLQKYRGLRQKTSVRNVDWAADESGKPTADNSSGSSYGLRKIR
ncbi:hypothetical protein BJX63DRAFT_31587 [Aspergillus granulosus]|uniref:Copper acquisition factor BIM1-like domain-containing protein n=1 Tax=Aspergillus granulosus TaxID=176169 RepID=A0ABR4HUQ7_9EURO